MHTYIEFEIEGLTNLLKYKLVDLEKPSAF